MNKRIQFNDIGRATYNRALICAIPLLTDTGGSWLLGFPSGPVRPSLGNLILLGSPRKTMLMPALVRTPIQHASGVSRAPSLTLFQILASRKQDYRSMPSSQPECLELI